MNTLGHSTSPDQSERPILASTLDQTDIISGRLSAILSRLSQIESRVFGSPPATASAEGLNKIPEPDCVSAELRQRFDFISRQINQLEDLTASMERIA